MTEPVQPVAKPSRFNGVVRGAPIVRRNDEGEVTSIAFVVKAPFKGDVTIAARGDVAKAYWSVTEGMNLAITATQTGKDRYQAEALDVRPAGVDRK